MARLSAYMKKRRPDAYGSFDDDEIDADFASMLSSPDTREDALRKMRKVVPEWNDFSDDDLVSEFGRQQVEPTPAAERRETQKNFRFEQGAKSYEQMLDRVFSNMAEQQDGGPVSSDVVAKAQTALRETPTPEAAVPGERQRLQVVDDMREVRRLQAQNPRAEADVPGYGFGMQLQLQDETGAPIALLDMNASQAGVKGANVINKLIGTDSPLQQGAVSLVRKAIHDPSKESSLGEAPIGVDTGYGWREFFGDLGENQVRRDPSAAEYHIGEMQALGQGLKPVFQGMGAIDRAEEWAIGKLADAVGSQDGEALRIWQEMQKEEAEKYEGLVRDTESGLEYLQDIQAGNRPDVRDEVGQLAARTGGQMVGDTIASLDPEIAAGRALTTFKPVAKAIAAGKAAAEPVVNKAVGTVGGAIVDAMPGPARFISDMPSAFGVGGKGRTALLAGKSAKDQAPEVFRRKFEQEVTDALTPVFARHKKTSADDQRKLLKAARDAWHSIKTRQDAPEDVKDVIRALQPFNRRAFEYAKEVGELPEKLPYNHLHFYYGQDYAKAARMNESAAARKVEAAGGEAWQATPRNADVAKMTPEERAAIGLGDWSDADDTNDLRAYQDMVNNVMERLSAAKGDKWYQRGLAKSELDNIRRNYDETDAMSGLVNSFSKVAERHEAHGNLAAVKEILDVIPQLAKENPGAYRHYKELGLGPVEGQAVPLGRNKLGRVRKDDPLMLLEDEVDELVKGDKVIIRAGAEKADIGRPVVEKKVYMNLPKEFEAMDGVVVDRHFAQALHEMAVPRGQRVSSRVHSAVQEVDRLLGLNQLRGMITRGNLGFEARNRINELFRIGMDEKGALTDAQLRNLVAEVSKAPIGQKTGKTWTDGAGRTWDLGELHERLVSLGGVGKSMRRKQMEEEAIGPGAGKIVEAVPYVGKAINWTNRGVMKFGKKWGDATDAIFKSIYGDMNPAYSAEDANRMLSMLAKMKRGVDPQTAARSMKHLMIDYSIKSGAEELLGTAVPFIKYYSGAFQGAAKLALQNPRRFARFAEAARAIERLDQSVEGAEDPRLKEKQDFMSMTPYVQVHGEQTAIRPETPWSEMVNMISQVTGMDERGMGALLGPGVTTPLAALTGKDPATGRSVLGLSPDQMKRSDAGIVDQFAQAYKDQAATGSQILGENPEAQIPYYLLRYAPVFGGRVLSPQMDLAARALLGLGSSSASRSDDDSLRALLRGALSAATGQRTSTIDRQRAFGRKTREAADSLPQSFAEMLEARARRGYE